MRADRFASLAAALVVGGGTLLAASRANAAEAVNGWSLNGWSLNGVALNGIPLNGTATSAGASQGFDFNYVSAQGVSWTAPCPLPLDRR